MGSSQPKDIRLAVALKYEKDHEGAPVVVAAGKGEVAEKILERAQEEDIPLYRDESLAGVLSTLEVGTEVPPELYQAVAQVIAFVWQLDEKYKGS